VKMYPMSDVIRKNVKENLMPPKVLFTILDMGLGHATRSLPVIKKFIELKWEVFIGSNGRSQTFLKKELPQVVFFDFPDYGLKYSKNGVEIFKILFQLPLVFKKIVEEHSLVKHLVYRKNVNLIISDQRFGCFHHSIPSYFITHQLRFIAPPLFRPFEILGKVFNRLFHDCFKGILIPDVQSNGNGLLTGRLSELNQKKKYCFTGILSSIERLTGGEEDIDIFCVISGPEPQRTIFEKMILEQIPGIPGKKVIALGKPESRGIKRVGKNLTIYDHLGRNKMRENFNRSRLIICRSGYSTVMELAELRKKALLVPTPGQTEQNYLANRFFKNNWFYYTKQNQLNLNQQISKALKYSGIPFQLSTEQAVKTIIKEIGIIH
jgi:UDP-N-acetylglucosamine:LPS N-acetylglucosamine transferase